MKKTKFKIRADDKEVWIYLYTKDNIVYGKNKFELTGCLESLVIWVD